MPAVRRTVALAALLCCSLAVAACGGDTISQDDLQDQVKVFVDKVAGLDTTGVDCPNELEAEVGKRTTCTVSYVNGAKAEVVVNVTAIKDGNASLHVQITRQVG